MKKISIIFLACLLVACSKTQDITQTTKNYSEALTSKDYRLAADQKLSTTRDAHKDRQRTKKDIDAIRKGMLEISKLHFPVDQFVLNELDILSFDRLTSVGTYGFDDIALLDYVSDTNPYGLNPFKDKEISFGSFTLKGPELVTDLFELDFVRENDKSNQISGISTALILSKSPFNQENKKVIIPENILIEYGKEASNKLQNYLMTLPQLANVPIVVSLFVAESEDINVPGRFVGYTTYDKGNSKYTAVEEIYYYLGNEDAKKYNGDLNNLFTVYSAELNKVLYENIGVVGLVRMVNGQTSNLNIEINAQFKSFVEEEILLQEISDSFSLFKDNSYQILITLKDVNEVKALFERKVNQNDVTLIRR